jgi:hypothetical protein
MLIWIPWNFAEISYGRLPPPVVELYNFSDTVKPALLTFLVHRCSHFPFRSGQVASYWSRLASSRPLVKGATQSLYATSAACPIWQPRRNIRDVKQGTKRSAFIVILGSPWGMSAFKCLPCGLFSSGFPTSNQYPICIHILLVGTTCYYQSPRPQLIVVADKPLKSVMHSMFTLQITH